MYKLNKRYTTRYYDNLDTGKIEVEDRYRRPMKISDIEVVGPENYLGHIKVSERKVELVPGSLYKYQDKVFRLVKKLELTETTNSLIFKQLTGSKTGYIYLSKEDCELFELRYEPDLLTLPEGYGYEPIEETEVSGFSESDLSSYPSVDWRFKDKRQAVLLRLGGFKPREKPDLIQYENTIIELEPFLLSLNIKLNQNISRYKDYSEMWKDDDLSFGIITGDVIKESFKLSDQHIIDDSGNLYLFLDLRKNGRNISMLSLTGISIKDLITVSFDCAFSINNTDPDLNLRDNTYSSDIVEPAHKLYKQEDGIWWRTVEQGELAEQEYVI